MGLVELIYRGTLFRRIKNNFTFTSLEMKDFHTTNILISLIFFFFIWSFTDLNITTGAFTFLYIFLLSAISLFIYISIPKIVGIIRGNTVEYKSPVLTLLFFFIINFLSYGIIPIFVPGNLYLKSLVRIKHGEVFHYETKQDIFSVLISAPLTHIFISSILLSTYFLIPNIYLYYAILLNVFIALFSVFPLPGALGLELFYVKKHFYFPILFGVILYAIPTILKLQYAPLLGFFGLFIGWIFSEKNKGVQILLKTK